MTQKRSLQRLVETAVLLGTATVLSLIRVVDLPFGGSVTACSALPILLIAYRYGTRWGLFGAFVFSLLQLVTGMNALSYCPSFAAVVAVILLDYCLAFTALGFGGVFRRGRSQGRALVYGTVLTFSIRYVCHVIAGCTVWVGLSIPTEAALLYSLAYNATYLVPETLVTVVGAWYLSAAVDFGGERPTRPRPVESTRRGIPLTAKTALAVSGIADVILVFSGWQDAETGGLSLTGLLNAPWIAVAAVTAAGIALAVLLTVLSRRKSR